MTTDCNFAVAYARVSTKDQERTGHTLPMQSKNMLEYAQKKGLQIVKDFVVAESASKRDRTYYQEMWVYLGQHPEIKHIIFEEIDRFTRNDTDKVDLADRVNNDGYVAHFVMEKLTLDKETSPNDIFLFDILAAKAKNYSQALSQKVKKGQLGKLSKGGYPGGYPPFGYTKANSELVPDEPDATCVKKAFELCDEDHLPLSAIAKRLSKMGFRRRSHKKLTLGFVHHVLTNPIYAGVIPWMKQTYQGSHKCLVELRRFNRVNEWLHRKGPLHWGVHMFTYRGFLHCGECGCAITAETQKGFVYYHCTHYRKCSQRAYTREETLEEKFLEILQALRLKEKTAEAVRRGILARREEEYGFQKT
ncbi:MAG: recombinase family protein, partial [Planctomycetota bacterium]|nr:recombinase family protein [Planctomycetota bacterium]